MTKHRTTLVLLAAVVAFLGITFWNVYRSQIDSNRRTCLAQLYAIEGAKEQFAIEHDGIAPESMAQLIPHYLPKAATCPAGGVYDLGDMQNVVACSRVDHVPPWWPNEDMVTEPVESPELP